MSAARITLVASTLAALAPVATRAGADPAGGRPPAAAVSAPGPAAPFVVALDPGHGGSNLGKVAADGVLEKDVTLALARRLAARLAAAPGVRVVVCRERDVLVPIRARARCAAEARADLFLSLHANATPEGVPPGSERGFELYVLPPEDVDDDATLAALAARRAGAPSPADVWASRRVRALAPRAAEAAHALDGRLRAALGAGLARGVRQSGAALDVLRGTGAPSVLVEVGFLDSALDRALLESPTGQERVAAALAAGALEFKAAAAR